MRVQIDLYLRIESLKLTDAWVDVTFSELVSLLFEGEGFGGDGVTAIGVAVDNGMGVVLESFEVAIEVFGCKYIC